MALILWLAPNIRKLHFVFKFSDEHNILNLLFDHMLLINHLQPSLPMFSKLRHVEFQDASARKTTINRTHNYFRSFFTLPGIKTLIALLPYDEMIIWPSQIPQCAFMLTTLKLPMCAIKVDELRYLLSATPNYTHWITSTPLIHRCPCILISLS